MAVTPDAVLKAIQPLTDAEEAVVDAQEQILDLYLQANYYENGIVTWSPETPLTLHQTHELAGRYRAAGWRVIISPSTASSGYAFHFMKDQITGNSILNPPTRISGTQ